MANELDEMTGPVNGAGRDINVIEKQLPVRVGFGSTLFEIILWCLGILPGLIFLFMKIGAKNYFQKLQQKIQADASTIDNYLEQRVQILKNLAKLVEKAIDLDNLQRRLMLLRMHIHRNTTTVILYGNGVILINVHRDLVTESCQCLINRVIYHLINQMMQTLERYIADIHRRTFAHRL